MFPVQKIAVSGVTGTYDPAADAAAFHGGKKLSRGTHTVDHIIKVVFAGNVNSSNGVLMWFPGYAYKFSAGTSVSFSNSSSATTWNPGSLSESRTELSLSNNHSITLSEDGKTITTTLSWTYVLY